VLDMIGRYGLLDVIEEGHISDRYPRRSTPTVARSPGACVGRNYCSWSVRCDSTHVSRLGGGDRLGSLGQESLRVRGPRIRPGIGLVEGQTRA
jgi:hypothetical protein